MARTTPSWTKLGPNLWRAMVRVGPRKVDQRYAFVSNLGTRDAPSFDCYMSHFPSGGPYRSIVLQDEPATLAEAKQAALRRAMNFDLPTLNLPTRTNPTRRKNFLPAVARGAAYVAASPKLRHAAITGGKYAVAAGKRAVQLALPIAVDIGTRMAQDALRATRRKYTARRNPADLSGYTRATWPAYTLWVEIDGKPAQEWGAESWEDLVALLNKHIPYDKYQRGRVSVDVKHWAGPQGQRPAGRPIASHIWATYWQPNTTIKVRKNGTPRPVFITIPARKGPQRYDFPSITAAADWAASRVRADGSVVRQLQIAGDKPTVTVKYNANGWSGDAKSRTFHFEYADVPTRANHHLAPGTAVMYAPPGRTPVPATVRGQSPGTYDNYDLTLGDGFPVRGIPGDWLTRRNVRRKSRK